MHSIKVPATIANIGPGFDTFGLALSLFIHVSMSLTSAKNQIHFSGEGRDLLQDKPQGNYVLAGAQRVFAKAGVKHTSLRIEIHNDIPVGKGLGSSAAAIIAGMFLANALLGYRFSRSQLIWWAVEMEGHADNILPAVWGGFTTALQLGSEVLHQSVTFPGEISIVVVVPDFSLDTQKTRQLIPEYTSTKNCIANLQRASFLLASIFNKDFAQISMAMDDALFQKTRQEMIPGFYHVAGEARAAGALGVVLSGGGPSVAAFTLEKENAIGESMQKAFLKAGVKNRIYYLKPHQEEIEWQQMGSE